LWVIVVYGWICIIEFWYELDLFYDGEEIRDFKKINENIKFYLKL
jgi:hypothetical protein